MDSFKSDGSLQTAACNNSKTPDPGPFGIHEYPIFVNAAQQPDNTTFTISIQIDHVMPAVRPPKEHLFWYNIFRMSIWQRFLYLIGLRPISGPRTYEISESLQVSLSTLAEHEGRPEHELIPDLLAAGLTEYSTKGRLWKKWESLTPREQEVTALICLGYTNGQMAFRLGITEAGVKFHVHNVLAKFGAEKRAELRRTLAGWDFSAWL